MCRGEINIVRGEKLITSKRQYFLFSFLSVLLASAIIFFVGELVCRIFDRHIRYQTPEKADFIQISKNRFIGWELKPNIPGHNSFGMRDREYSLKKNREVLRIAIIGDSVTYGYGVENQEVFSEVLERNLNRLEIGPVEVLNFGIPGHSPFQEYMILNTKALKFKPDLVIMTFTGDDVETSPVVIRVNGIFCLFTNHFEGSWWFNNHLHWSLFRYSSLYRWIYKNLILGWMSIDKNEFSDPYVNPEAAWKSVVMAKELSQKNDARFLLLLSPFLLPPANKIEEKTDKYLKALKKFKYYAEKSGVAMVDLTSIYQQNFSRLKVSESDFEHPNALGHQLIAEILQERLTHNEFKNKTGSKKRLVF
jgi:lysophospholipase L1-like esterase